MTDGAIRLGLVGVNSLPRHLAGVERMFSVQKLATLIAVTGAVVYGSRLIGRVGEIRRAMARGRSRPEPGARRWVRGESLHHCSRCDVYVSRGAAGNCDQPDCPAPTGA